MADAPAMNPAYDCVPVVPSDSADLPFKARGISFAAAGAVVVITWAGNQRTITSGALAAGVIHPVACTRVLATGTTATGIMAYE